MEKPPRKTGIAHFFAAASYSAGGLRRLAQESAFRQEAGIGLVIQTADCLPVLLATADGQVIGAAHAGWRGLAAGILENDSPPYVRLSTLEPRRTERESYMEYFIHEPNE